MIVRLRPIAPLILMAGAAVLAAVPAPAQWASPGLTQLASVNSPQSDFGPSPSSDGLTLYFTSNRASNFEIFAATRSSLYGSFGAPRQLTELSSTGTEAGPCVRGDELEIFFYSTRAGGTGGLDIWRATRPSAAVTFSAPVPVTELNTATSEFGPSITADGLTIFFTSDRAGGQGGRDIWTATRPNLSSPFGTPTNVTEINSSMTERDPSVADDGLAIFWASDRPGTTGGTDIWMASRLSITAPFSTPVLLTTLASTTADVAPGVAQFRDEIFFCSSRTGGPGSYDIYNARFTGLTSLGYAGPGKTMQLLFSDPGSVGRPYYAAASFGSTPGIPLGTRTIPLNPDLLFGLSAGGFPPILNRYAGTLNGNGLSTGFITFPNNPVFVGITFYNAFVVVDPAAPFGIKTISNAHAVLTQ